MARLAAPLALGLAPVVCLLAACGGGGGGGPAEPTIPGTLQAVALEGAATPAGGVYGPLAPDLPLSAAVGGWVAFVAPVAGGTAPGGLFVVRPDGFASLVFALGEAVPATNGGTGTINDIVRVWMRPGGVVAAYAEVNGASGEGVLTARVQPNGTVVEKAGAVYLGRTLPSGTAPGTPGTLASIDEGSVVVDDDGDVFFTGTGSNALSGCWTVDRSGAPIVAVAVQGASAPGGGAFGGSFDGVGTDATGSLALFAVDVNGSEALFATLDGSNFLRVSSDGDGPQGTPGRFIEDVHDGGPLVVRFDGTSGDVTWRAGLTGSSPDRAVLSRQVVAAGGLQLGALATLLAPGATLPGTANGLVTDVRLLPCVPGPARWPLEAGVAGGSTSRVYYSEMDRTSALTEVWRQGEVAPGGGAWGTVYPSMALDGDSDGYAVAGSDGSLAFSAVLADATSGVWWAVVGLDFFLVAKEGATAPVAGGPVFASFGTPSAVTTDDGVVAFRAALTGGAAPTGLFRQY